MVVLFEDPHTSPLATFLMQVFITLVVCKVLAKLLSFIRQPQVIGQIIAGIIFGPSLLGFKLKDLIFLKKFLFFRRSNSSLDQCNMASEQYSNVCTYCQFGLNILHVFFGKRTRFRPNKENLENYNTNCLCEHHRSW